METLKGPSVLGIDVGGTKLAAGLVDATGTVHYAVREATDRSAAVDQILRVIRHYKDEYGIQAVGVGMPGQVHAATGTVVHSVTLGLDDYPLREVIEQDTGLLAAVHNDVNAITCGEWIHGAGQGATDVICLFLGTGIGGGVVQNGELLLGAGETAAELGHMTVNLDGRLCVCGNVGCIEAYASGTAIAERAREAVNLDLEAGMKLIELAGDIPSINARTVAEACHAGDPFATHFVEETGRYLGAACVNILHAFNPERLILGGSVVIGIPELVDHAADWVERFALPPVRESVEIYQTDLADRAGIIGASLLARPPENIED